MTTGSIGGVLICTSTVVIIDRISKIITRTYLEVGESISVIGNFFCLTHVQNSGIAFGINFKGGPILFTIFAIIAVIGIAIYIWKVRGEHMLKNISLALILGGAIGNLLDRFLFGKVTDFLHFSIGRYQWPVFNVADSAVTVGMILFLYYSFFKVEHINSDT